MDWELATLGDPLADLGWLLAFWREPTDEPHLTADPARAVMEQPGFPSRAELAARYAEQTGAQLPDLTYYVVFAMWRMAVLLENHWAATCAAAAAGFDFAYLETAGPAFAARLRRLAEQVPYPPPPLATRGSRRSGGAPCSGMGGAGGGGLTTSPLDLYRWLVVARVLDRALCAENPNWFPIEGEEATVVGAYADLRPTDVAAPHYRDPFVVYLMRGAEMWRLAAQVLRKGAGYNKGRSVPFNGPFELRHVPWVAGDLGTTLGTATGAALALQDAGTDDVCVCAFGDGTANRGDFHENVNLAACWRLPIVYLCQHNGWAISEPAEIYLPAPIVDRAAGYGIPGVVVDGNDVEAVQRGRRRGRRAGAARRRPDADRGPDLAPARPLGRRRRDLPPRPGPDGRARPAGDPGRAAAHRGARPTPRRSPESASEAEAEVAEAIARAKALPEAGAAELGLNEVFV